MYEHQDWNTVTFNTKQKKGDVETQLRNKNVQSDNPINIKKLDDNPEIFALKKVDRELADAIKSKRCELKMTQAMLAQRINEKPNVIQEVETMKAVYNHVIINKILKALGLTLKIIRNK